MCAQFAEAGKIWQQSCAPVTEECDNYDCTAHPCTVTDSQIIMIGPGGLLLLVSHQFAVVYG
jgi:hypothetical protein